jgi:hypothetical protein
MGFENLKIQISKLASHVRQRRTRRFHCYCVGAAKTGTTSIASSFGKFYKTAHEPEALKTNRLVIKYLEGNIGIEGLREHLLDRDKRLRLELESAHPLGYVSGVLADIFPQSLFIVTIREPLSWLHSRLNFHHKTDPPAWAEYRQYFWTQRHKGFAPEEKALQRYKLCSLDTYLSQYADHYRRVFSEMPEDRRLVIDTSELENMLPSIAGFLGADPLKIVPSHNKRDQNKIKPLEEIDDAFINGKIMLHCSDLVSKYFPERLSYYTNSI